MIDAKRKAMIFLVLAFILALITAWFITNQMSEAQQVLGQSVKVAVAKQDVPAYTEITSDMIEWMELPKSSDLSSLIRDEKNIVGNVSIVNLKKGDLFTANLVRSRVDIPSDHRVVWLNPTENVIMDQQIAAGDHIDIIASYKTSDAIVTKRILANISVVQSEEISKGEEEKSQVALKVSLPIAHAEQLIHMQNTAEQVRVLRVNQVQPEETENEGSQQQTNQQPAEQPKPQQTDQSNNEQQPNQEKPKEEQPKEQGQDKPQPKEESKNKEQKNKEAEQNSEKETEDKK